MVLPWRSFTPDCSSNCVHACTFGGFGVAMVLLLDYQTICLIVCVLGVDLVGISDVQSNPIQSCIRILVKWIQAVYCAGCYGVVLDYHLMCVH